MSNQDVNFNLQQFLADMRDEMHDGFNRIDATASKVREDLQHHEKADLRVAADIQIQLDRAARFQSNARWMLRTIAAAVVVAAIGALFAAFR